MLSCGLCPHPASGIRLEFSGNTLNADGIRLGRPPFHLEPPWLFLFINTGSAFPHTGRSAGSVPGPSPGISASTFLWCFHWPDTAFFLKTGHWEIHFWFLLPFDTGGLTLPVCWSCYHEIGIARPYTDKKTIPLFSAKSIFMGSFWKNVSIVFCRYKLYTWFF